MYFRRSTSSRIWWEHSWNTDCNATEWPGHTADSTSLDGTVYKLATGLHAFVETLPTSGKEGATINILGQDFSSSSVVKFGGTMATSVVFSGTTLMTAKVPVGGLTGPVTVTTGSTTLSSTPFKVLPTLTGFTPPSGTVGTIVTISGTGLKQTVGGAGRLTQLSDSSNNYVGYSGNVAMYSAPGHEKARSVEHRQCEMGVVGCTGEPARVRATTW